ncbi:MAG TPA: hypothetical protein DCY74_02265 [Clostridiales bacterium]|jgi:hypothetical protein|nr:hypothetical protein [Clostridiales bacterium]HBE12976.1 hypothetical protein [Clostridiales bacterium]
MKLVNIGFGNMVNIKRVVALVSPESSPVKRMIQDAKESGRAVDVTCGRKTRSVLITDSDHVLLSALQPDTLSARLNGKDIADEEVRDE